MIEEKRGRTEGRPDTEKSSPLPAYGLAEDILGNDASAECTGDTKVETGREGGEDGNQEGSLMKIVTFFLENEEYGIPIVKVQEIRRIDQIIRVPNAPHFIRGVMNLRGRILPVVDLKERLNIGCTSLTDETRIVVIEQQPRVLGLLVDRVSQVMNIVSNQIEEVPEGMVSVHENSIKGVGKVDDRMVMLLDLDRIAAFRSEVC